MLGNLTRFSINLHLFVHSFRFFLDSPVSDWADKKWGAREKVQISVFRFGLAADYKITKQRSLLQGHSEDRGHSNVLGSWGSCC